MEGERETMNRGLLCFRFIIHHFAFRISFLLPRTYFCATARGIGKVSLPTWSENEPLAVSSCTWAVS